MNSQCKRDHGAHNNKIYSCFNKDYLFETKCQFPVDKLFDAGKVRRNIKSAALSETGIALKSLGLA